MTRKVLEESRIHPAARPTIEANHVDIINEVEQAMTQNKVVVVGMRQNPFPKKARKALDTAGVRYQFMQAAPHEIRMTACELKEAGEFPFGLQRRAISLVKIRNLSGGEIVQCQTRSNVERRLVHVVDEERRLG